MQPRTPWENGCNESFDGEPRHELLNREISCTLKEAEVLVEPWRREYNIVGRTLRRATAHQRGTPCEGYRLSWLRRLGEREWEAA